MPRVNLTSTFIKSIDVTDRVAFQDDRQRGLELRASPGGDRTWTVIYKLKNGTKKYRATLGKWPEMDPVRARAAALQVLRRVEEGGNPSAEKKRRRDELTIKTIGEEFIRDYAMVKKRSWKEDQRILATYINPELGKQKVHELSRSDVVAVLAKIVAGTHRTSVGRKRSSPSPVMADRTLALLRKMLNWAMSHDMCQTNPAVGIEAQAPKNDRDRVLSSAEIRDLWTKLPALHSEAAAVLQLLLLTGQRLGEVCGMRAGEVDVQENVWTIPASRAKNKRVHLVPLVPAALELVKPRLDGLKASDPVFTRREMEMDTSYMAKLVKGLQTGEDRWTPHDLRRTAATGMAAVGVQPHVIEAVLNHISGSRAGVAGIYNRHSYAKEKQRALEKWGMVVNKLVR